MSTPSGSRRGSTSSARILRSPPGKRSVVTQHQARHLVQLVRLLEREALNHFRVPVASKLPKDRYAESFRLEAYRIFIEGAYACGFVCRDLKPDNPLEGERRRAAAVIAGWLQFNSIKESLTDRKEPIRAGYKAFLWQKIS